MKPGTNDLIIACKHFATIKEARIYVASMLSEHSWWHGDITRSGRGQIATIFTRNDMRY